MTGRRGLGVLALAVVLCACSSPNGQRARPPATTSTLPGPSATTSTSAVNPATGVRTVLSPVGLNIRAGPSTSAAVVRTAAQGAVLTVVAQSSSWFEVKGPTVTGWITDDPTLSAPGRFSSYSSTQHQVSLLYPEGWTPTELPPDSVVFRPTSGNDTVVLTTAPTIAQLGRGRPGYHQTGDQQVVVCGVTGDMVTFVQMSGAPATTGPGASTTTTRTAAPQGERYLLQVHLTLAPQHALGIDANFADLSQLESYRNLVYSVTFPFPQCRPAGS